MYKGTKLAVMLVTLAVAGLTECEGPRVDGSRAARVRVRRQEWSAGSRQNIIARNPAHAHSYVEVANGGLRATGSGDNESSVFSLFSALYFHPSKGLVELVVIESAVDGKVLAIDPNTDAITLKRIPKAVTQYQTIQAVMRAIPEALFYRISTHPGGVYFYLASYLTDKRRVVGFNRNGEPLRTTQVAPGTKASLLRSITARI